MNQEKTKVMKITREDRFVGQQGDCGVMRVEAKEDLKYLLSILNSKNRMEEEVVEKIAAGARCAWVLNKLLASREISSATKVKA